MFLIKILHFWYLNIWECLKIKLLMYRIVQGMIAGMLLIGQRSKANFNGSQYTPWKNGSKKQLIGIKITKPGGAHSNDWGIRFWLWWAYYFTGNSSGSSGILNHVSWR